MRRALLGLAIFGCGGGGVPPEDDGGGGDARADARPDAARADAGADAQGMDFASTPGSVQCGSTLTCLSMSFACCMTRNGTMVMTSCSDPGTCATGAMSVEIDCDETPDCAMGELCCRSASAATCMMGSCGSNVQLCAKNAECVSGQCKAYTCPVEGVVHACAQPPGCN